MKNLAVLAQITDLKIITTLVFKKPGIFPPKSGQNCRK
jgi:hypothetical protein